ncbi:MAG: ABC transporter substrate-binding protein [Acidimicrobiia bacterium]|nr:ABC transporter substrate-binding protein [Acidimicrobiia bacterium]
MSVPTIGALIAACGSSDDAGQDATAVDEDTGNTEDTSGGEDTSSEEDTGSTAAAALLVIGSGTPSAASANLDPVLINDQNGLTILSSVGQTLLTSNPDLSLSPLLATEWSPNADGSEWTFKLNPAATFNDGTPVTAADVVATMERLVDPDNNSNALSAFEVGRLSPGGITAVDDNTVLFRLDGPMGNFPYIVSSDNYNSFVLPASVTDTSAFATANIPTTGAYMIESYDGVKGATLVRNPNYWGPAAPIEKIEFQFIDDLAAQITAFTSGELDVMSQFSVSGGESLLDNPDVNVIEHPSTAHRQIHLRTSKGPFADKRVRQALAMAMDRGAIIDGLFSGKANIANDSPFFDVFPSTGTPVKQEYNLDKAKALMAEAAPDGFDTTLYGFGTQEIPDLAVIVQNAARELGINITIEMRDDYYDNYWVSWDESVPGSDIGITDYGHRGVPDVFLAAPLKSADKGGVWNGAEFANPTYDALVDEYSASTDLQSQQAASAKIQTLLVDEVPIIFPYNYNYLSAVKTNISGVVTGAMGYVYTDQAAKS